MRNTCAALSDSAESKPAILYIVPSDLTQLASKGVLSLLDGRDEGGFFGKIYTLHPLATKSRIARHGRKQCIIERTARLGKWKLLVELLWVLPRKLHSLQLHMVRAQDPFYIGLLGLFYARWLKLPFAVSIHSDYELYATANSNHYMLGSPRLTRLVERFVVNRADAVWVMSQHLKNQMILRYPACRERIQLFRHVIEKPIPQGAPEDFSWIKLSHSSHVISFVGRLSHEKFPLDIIAITRALKQKRSDFVVIISGDGHMRKILEDAVCLWGLNENIKFMGFVSRSTTFHINSIATVVMPLVGGFSLIEALASKKPVVAYDIDWCGEVIEDGSNGCLLARGDIQGVADKLNMLLSNPVLCEQYGTAGYKTYEINFSPSSQTRYRQSLYKKLITRSISHA